MVLIRVCVVHNCSQKQSQPVLWIEIVCCITNFVIYSTVDCSIGVHSYAAAITYVINFVVHYISYSYMVQLLVMVSRHSLGPCSLMYRPESADVVHVLGVFH